MTYVPNAIATHTPPRPTTSHIAAVVNFLRPNRTNLREKGLERKKTAQDNPTNAHAPA